MKKLIFLTLFLAAYYCDLVAQTCIEYKESGIIIRPNAIDRIGNQIRYDITAPIDQLDIAQDMLGVTMTCRDGVCSWSGIVPVNNLDELYHAYKAEQSDVNKYVYQMEQRFASNIILNFGLLKLDYNWTLKDK